MSKDQKPGSKVSSRIVLQASVENNRENSVDLNFLDEFSQDQTELIDPSMISGVPSFQPPSPEKPVKQSQTTAKMEKFVVPKPEIQQVAVSKAGPKKSEPLKVPLLKSQPAKTARQVAHLGAQVQEEKTAANSKQDSKPLISGASNSAKNAKLASPRHQPAEVASASVQKLAASTRQADSVRQVVSSPVAQKQKLTVGAAEVGRPTVSAGAAASEPKPGQNGGQKAVKGAENAEIAELRSQLAVLKLQNSDLEARNLENAKALATTSKQLRLSQLKQAKQAQQISQLEESLEETRGKLQSYESAKAQNLVLSPGLKATKTPFQAQKQEAQAAICQTEQLSAANPAEVGQNSQTLEKPSFDEIQLETAEPKQDDELYPKGAAQKDCIYEPAAQVTTDRGLMFADNGQCMFSSNKLAFSAIGPDQPTIQKSALDRQVEKFNQQTQKLIDKNLQHAQLGILQQKQESIEELQQQIQLQKVQNQVQELQQIIRIQEAKIRNLTNSKFI